MRQILIADAVADRGYPVLFRQGDLDGACGLYALMMGLNLCGYVDDETSFALEPDRRTQIGKLYKQFEGYPALFSGGTYIEDIKKVVDEAFGRKIETEFLVGKNKELVDFTVSHLCEGHPVILGVQEQGGRGHALTACGVEFEYGTDELPEDEDDAPDPHKILTLDPDGYEVPSFVLWNSFIYYERQSGGKFPYLYIGAHCEEKKVTFGEALALWSSD